MTASVRVISCWVLGVAGVLVGACSREPNLVCVATPEREDAAVCNLEVGRCDTLSKQPTCKLSCVVDSNCAAQGLAASWQCVDGLCTDCTKDSDRCGCQEGSDCLSGVCDAYGSIAPLSSPPVGRRGRCIAESWVLYVDSSCDPTLGDGKRATPFCALEPALTAALPAGALTAAQQPGGGAKRIIQITGRDLGYDGLDLGAHPVAEPLFLFGPGQRHHAATQAKLGSLRIVPGSSLPVTIDGLTISNSDGTPLVSCAGPAGELTIRRSYFAGKLPLASAITGNSCTLNFDSDWFDGITSAGLLFLDNSSQLTVKNSYFTNNSVSSLALLSLNNSATMSFAYNTLVGNGSVMPKRELIDCGQRFATVDYSIIQAAAGQALTNNCTVLTAKLNPPTTDLVPDPNRPGAPPYRLMATDSSCCVDKGEYSPSVRWDYFGQLRPSTLSTDPLVQQVAQSDVGAEELVPATN